MSRETIATKSPRNIDVWYHTDQMLCNFCCEYCVAGQTKKKNPMWAEADGAQRFERIINWISKQPFNIRIRLQTEGEPFVCNDFIKGAAWLSHQKNIRSVELVTNGSLLKKRFSLLEEHGVVSKMALWVTYHYSQINEEKLLEQVLYAKEKGADVTVNMLLFPDSVDKISTMSGLCEKHQIRSYISMGHGDGHMFDGSILPILNDQKHSGLFSSPDLSKNGMLSGDLLDLTNELMAFGNVEGQLCSSGHDYVYIHADGSIFPCGPYTSYNKLKLGSALDEQYQLTLRDDIYAPCQNSRTCQCKEDNLHLKLVREYNSFQSKSLGIITRKPDKKVDTRDLILALANQYHHISQKLSVQVSGKKSQRWF